MGSYKTSIHERIAITHEDILNVQCDVLVLEYNQSMYSAATAATEKLGVSLKSKNLAHGQYALLSSEGKLPCKNVLLLGIENQQNRDLKDIYTFIREAISRVTLLGVECSTIAMTMFQIIRTGSEKEIFESQITGIVDSLKDLTTRGIGLVTIAERELSRVQRYKAMLPIILTNLCTPNEAPLNSSDSLIVQSAINHMQDRCGPNEAKHSYEEYLVFISSSSKDYKYAEELYDFLETNGIPIFFSDRSLPNAGNSDYRREIDKALEGCTHLVLVVSKREHLDSKWVEAEWGLFINELRSGFKTGNLLTFLVGEMTIRDLPPSLRNHEVIPFSPEGFKKSLRYLMPPSSTLTHGDSSKSETETPACQRGIITGNRVSLRSAPSVVARLLKNLNQGDEIEVISDLNIEGKQECQLKNDITFVPENGKPYSLLAGKGLIISGETSTHFRIEINRSDRVDIGHIAKEEVVVPETMLWHKVKIGELQGWVFSRYVTIYK